MRARTLPSREARKGGREGLPQFRDPFVARAAGLGGLWVGVGCDNDGGRGKRGKGEGETAAMSQIASLMKSNDGNANNNATATVTDMGVGRVAGLPHAPSGCSLSELYTG